jgi:hypothetical protein
VFALIELFARMNAALATLDGVLAAIAAELATTKAALA